MQTDQALNPKQQLNHHAALTSQMPVAQSKAELMSVADIGLALPEPPAMMALHTGAIRHSCHVVAHAACC